MQFFLQNISIPAASEEAEQIEEEIDEVEVKREGTVERELLGAFVHFALGIEHLLDFLRVVGGKGGENHNADSADDKVEHRIVEEDVDDSSDNQADKRHECKLADSAEVLLGEAAHEGHSSEGAGRHEERSSDRSHGEGTEYRAESEAVKDAVENEDKRSRLERHTHQSGCENHDYGKLGNEDSPEEDPIGDKRIHERFRPCTNHSRECGYYERERHPKIDVAHESSHSRVEAASGLNSVKIQIFHT